MDVLWDGFKWFCDSFWKIFLWVLGKLWQLWYGTYLWLIPSVGEAAALLIVTLIPVIIALVLLYMSIAKTQIGIEMFGHTSFQYGLMAIGVILVIVILVFILPSLE